MARINGVKWNRSTTCASGFGAFAHRLPPSSAMNFIDHEAIGEERFVPHDG
jgi:hypothetical protein